MRSDVVALSVLLVSSASYGWSQAHSDWSEDTYSETLATVGQRVHHTATDQHNTCVTNLRQTKWSCVDNWTRESCAHSCQGADADSSIEREALLAALSHLHPATHRSIGAGQRACTFAGVECHEDVFSEGNDLVSADGNITSIDWTVLAEVTTAYNTAGSTEWHEITYNYTLNLTQGDPSRTIPWDQLAKLQNLRTVRMQGEDLGGDIGGLAQLQNLEGFVVIDNKLSGTLPLELPPNLSHLLVWGNMISGTLPRTIRRLKMLNAGKNKISGTVPWMSLSWYCTNSTSNAGVVMSDDEDCGLQVLNLDQNQISGEMSVELGAMMALKTLRVAKNKLTGMIPWDAMSRLPKLSHLDISYNPFENGLDGDGYDVSRAQCFYETCYPLLTDLQASNCGLRRIPEAVQYMPSLFLLNMASNAITGVLPPGLLRHPTLRWLLLQDNQLTSMPDANDLHEAEAWIKRRLALSTSSWTELNAPTLSPTPSPTTNESAKSEASYAIDCVDNPEFLDEYGYTCAAWEGFPCVRFPGYSEWQAQRVQINCPVTCFTCPETVYPLQILGMSNNQLEGNLQFMVVYKHLVSAWLDDNAFTGSIPNEIFKMESLQHLAADRNLLTGTIPDEMCNLTSLDSLDLHQNQISGTLPNHFLDLPRIQHLRLSYNKLSGTIAVNSDTLKTLELSNNHISGTLQTIICDSLEYLSLNVNSLEAIDESIGQCSRLRVLQLLDNKIIARLPSEAFNNLTALRTLFLAGNGLSCELPLMKNASMLGKGGYVSPVLTALRDAANSTLSLINQNNCTRDCQTIKSELQTMFTELMIYENSTLTQIENAVLVAPGNSFTPNHKKMNFLSERSVVSEMIVADMSMLGHSDYFPSDSQFWIFAIWQVPVAVGFYIVTLLLWIITMAGCCGCKGCCVTDTADNEDDCCDDVHCPPEGRSMHLRRLEENDTSMKCSDLFTLNWKDEKVYEVKFLRRLLLPIFMMTVLGCGLLIPFYYFQEGFIQCPYLFTQLTSAYIFNDSFEDWTMFLYATGYHVIAAAFFYIGVSFVIDCERHSLTSSHLAAFNLLRRYAKNPPAVRAIRIWQENKWGFLPGLASDKNKGLARADSLTKEAREKLNLSMYVAKSDDGSAVKPRDPPGYREAEHNAPVDAWFRGVPAPIGDDDETADDQIADVEDGTELILRHRSPSSLSADKDNDDGGSEGIVCLSTTCCKSFWRSAIVRLLTMVGLAILAMPSFVFVLSGNVPHDGSAAYISSTLFWDTFGNSGFLALLSGLIETVIVPEFARLFVWAEGSFSGHLPLKQNILKYKYELTTMIAMSFLLSVIMPLLWVLLLDHSCFRYYILFDERLKSILEGWNESRTGSQAYQRGHCTRRLIELYGCVWAARLLMMAFFGPALKYIKGSTKLQRLARTGINKFNELRGSESDDCDKDAVPAFMARDLEHIQEDISVTYLCLGITTVFGFHVPLLYPLALCYLMTNSVAVKHIVQSKLCEKKFSNITETIMLRFPTGPIFMYVIVFYLFATWFVWDNNVLYCHVVYSWPGVVFVLMLWTIWAFGTDFGKTTNLTCCEKFRKGFFFVWDK